MLACQIPDFRRCNLFNTAGHSFDRELIMLNVRWYLTYKLSIYRDLMEMAEERGVKVSHTSIYRWVIKFTPDIEAAVRCARKTTGNSWFADETYIKVNGRWKYLYRAV